MSDLERFAEADAGGGDASELSSEGRATSSPHLTGAKVRGSFNQIDRIKGLLLGCAIGDALGMPVESSDNDKTLQAIRRLGGIRDFLAPQHHVYRSLRRLRPGCWTDDTQLTLAIAQSIVRCQTVDYDDIADAHVNAFENLELRGWGGATKQSCRRLAQGTSRIRSGKRGGAGNGVATKIGPVAAWSYYLGETREQLLRHLKFVGIMTHLDPRPIAGAYVMAKLLQHALTAPRKWEPTEDLLELLIDEAEWAEELLTTKPKDGADRVSKALRALRGRLDAEPDELAQICSGATSYTVFSVPFVVGLLCSRPWEFEEGVLAAVNVGGDTDSNGAMVGSTLGAAFGARKLPKRYVEKVEEGEMIREVADRLGRTLLGETLAAA
jgi:ADP-ribosylglycohydrolase